MSDKGKLSNAKEDCIRRTETIRDPLNLAKVERVSFLLHIFLVRNSVWQIYYICSCYTYTTFKWHWQTTFPDSVDANTENHNSKWYATLLRVIFFTLFIVRGNYFDSEDDSIKLKLYPFLHTGILNILKRHESICCPFAVIRNNCFMKWEL